MSYRNTENSYGHRPASAPNYGLRYHTSGHSTAARHEYRMESRQQQQSYPSGIPLRSAQRRRRIRTNDSDDQDFMVIHEPRGRHASDSDSTSPPAAQPPRRVNRSPNSTLQHRSRASSARTADFRTPRGSSNSRNYSGHDYTPKSEPIWAEHNHRHHHKSKKFGYHSSRPRARVTYKEIKARSLGGHRNKSRRRRERSTSVEVKFDSDPPPAASPRPCMPSRRETRPFHTNWNQCYEPATECEDSGPSSREPIRFNHEPLNTTVYCPEPQHPSETQSSGVRRLSKGYLEDQALRTQVTISEKHRAEPQDVNGRRSVSPSITDEPPPRAIRTNRSPNSNQTSPQALPLSARLRAARIQAGLPESPDDDGHVFPFRQTTSGNIKVDPDQISFENKKVAVLISDPKNTVVKVKQNPGDSKKGGIKKDKSSPPPFPPPRPPTVPLVPQLPDEGSSDEHISSHGTNKKKTGDIRPPDNSRMMPSPGSDHTDVSQHWDSESSKAREKVNRTTGHINKTVQTSDIEYDSDSKRSKVTKVYGAQVEEYVGSKDFMANMHYRMKRAINPDTTILIGGKEFPCHGLALQCYSKYFDKKRRPRDQMLVVEISERIIAAKEFRNLMDWILINDSDKKLVISKDNVVGLFSGSVYLDMPDLREDCLDFVRLKVEEEDPAILKMYEEAGLKENSQVLTALLSTKLSALFPNLYKSKQFLYMGVKELVTLLKSDTIKINSELDVYDAAARWLLFDWKAREKYTVEVMETVRFGLLSPLQLIQIRHSANSADMPDYANIYSFQEVNKFLNDGLSYSILRESYKGRPGELNRWVGISEMKPPNPRYNMDDDPDLNRKPARISFQYDDTPAQVPPDFSLQKAIQANKVFRRYSQENNNNWTQVDSYKRPENSKIFHTNFQRKDEPSVWNQQEIRLRAIILIQSKVRAWLMRRWFKRAKWAAIRIQIWYRAHRIRMHRRKEYTPLSIKKFTKHLTIAKRFVSNAPKVHKLTLENSAAFIIFGGYDPIQDVNSANNAKDIYQLDLTENVWSHMGQLPEPRIHSGAVRNYGTIILFGGTDPRYRNSQDKLIPSASTWCLDVDTGKWKKLADMQIARRNFGYATSSGKIFVFGGVDEDSNTLSSCEAYDPDYNSWSFIQSMDAPRTCMSVTKHDGLIWIAGGMAKHQAKPILKSVITYNVKQNRFSPGPSLPQPISNSSMISYRGQLFLIGGAGKIKGADKAQSLSNILILSGSEWSLVAQLDSSRHSHCQLNMGRYVILLGGINSFQMSALETVEVFNMEKHTTKTTLAQMPKKLTGLCGVVLH